MSGICGMAGHQTSIDVARETVRGMAGTLSHRGADGEAVYVDGDIGMGVKVLNLFSGPVSDAIITNEKKTVRVAADSEIYNFPELKAELVRKGHQFKTDTDSEVIVHLYEEHGLECAKFLKGVFAYALWDLPRRRLLLVRDRIGQRPLYYRVKGTTLVFASEIKAILAYGGVDREFDYQALDYYMKYRLIPDPLTIFKNIRKLSPASVLTYESGQVRVDRYWEQKFVEQPDISDQEYERTFLKLLENAIERRRMGSLSLGAFLSGGMDSGSLVSLLTPKAVPSLKTFSISFREPEYDESRYQNHIARYCGSDHHRFEVRTDSLQELVPSIVKIYDQPFGDSSALPSLYLARSTKQHVDSVMAGDGGDELLAGYTTYPGMLYSEYFRKLPSFLRQGLLLGSIDWGRKVFPSVSPYRLERVHKVLRDANLPFRERYKSKISFLKPGLRDRLYLDHVKAKVEDWNHSLLEGLFSKSDGLALLNQINFVDIQFRFTNTVLEKTQQMCMAQTLVARCPYLDDDLIDFSATLPPRLKLKGLQTKHLLHRVMKDKLPVEIHRKTKQGFTPPLAIWFKEDLHSYLKTMLLSKQSRVLDFFRKETLTEMVEVHGHGHSDMSESLWGLLCFEVWHRTYH